jgi:hypothetical protein
VAEQKRKGCIEMAMREIPFEEAKRIAYSKGLKPAKVKGTTKLEFTKGNNPRLEITTWEDFERLLQIRGLSVHESGGFMKVMKK